jgi:hypothetical protein
VRRPPLALSAVMTATLLMTVSLAAQVAQPASADPDDACLGEPGTTYTVATSGAVSSGTVTFTAAGSPDVTADYTLTTSDLVGHPSVLVSIQDRDRFGSGIEYLPQSRPDLGADKYWTTDRVGDAVTATFDVVAKDAAARVRLAQVLGDRGGNSEASTYTISWSGVGGVAVVSDPVDVDAVYHSGPPATSSGDSFAKANGEIEDLKTGDTLTSGSSFVVYQTKNSLSEWSIEFPAGARDIRVEKVALSGATHARNTLEPADRDDPAQGRDVQLPRHGVFTGSYGTVTGDGGANDGAPGQTYQEFVAFQVLFVAEECVVPLRDTRDTREDSTASTPVLNDGTLPSLAMGQSVWQQTDGTWVPLTVSSPAPDQVRYEADGVRVTLTGAPGTDASRGLIANAAGEVECEICATLPAGGVIEVWMFSEPRLVAAHLIDGEDCQTFMIPLGAPLDAAGSVVSGAHTLQLALPTASGMQAVNVGVTVGGPVPASVPAGEGPTVPVGLLAFGLLAAAGAVVAVRRQVVTG